MFKKFFKRTVLAASMIFTAALGFSYDSTTLIIYTWNEEFPSICSEYIEPRLPANVNIEYVISPSYNSEYINCLDEALLRQKAGGHAVDIFLVEPDYAGKYINSEFTQDIKSLGITDKDLSHQYEYTQKFMTSNNGKLKGLTWQINPSSMIYRRSIAKRVFGTDNPEVIQNLVSDWNAVESTAAKLRSNGYFFTGGTEDLYKMFIQEAKTSFVSNGALNVDASYSQWAELTKDFLTKNYIQNTSAWSMEWMNGMTAHGDVFAYFGPYWFEEFIVGPAASDYDFYGDSSSYGDWAVCPGPASFEWGGSYLCVAAGAQNTEIIRELLLTLTCDDAVAEEIALYQKTVPNNTVAIRNMETNHYCNSRYLAGMNPFTTYRISAERMNVPPAFTNEFAFQQLFFKIIDDNYFSGYQNLRTAIDKFYREASSTYIY